MIKILFVCHGNICRSPMAEFILKDMAQKLEVADKIQIASCATSTEEIGNPVYPPARAELTRHGLDAKGKCAVQHTKADYDTYDLLIAMDSNNIRNIHRMIGGDPLGKVKKLMDYTSRGGDVADPWYNGHFERTYKDIYDGCLALIRHLKDNNLI